MSHRVACTIAAKSYLAYARSLARSFRRVHPDIPFVVLLADRVDGYFDPAAEEYELLTLDDLDIPDVERFRFHYPQQPLTYACTPYLIAALRRRGCSRIVFFKQETLVLASVDPVFDLLDEHAIVLTPHLVEPLAGTDRIARELNVLQSGVYNVGMLGVGDDAVVDAFLSWWQDRVYTGCRHAVAEGMHFEQRWLDLAPSFFPGVHLLRDPAYNVAHWNLPDRQVTLHGDEVFVDGRACRVFRFSGYDPDRPREITRYNSRLSWEAAGPARQVFERFHAALGEAGHDTTRHWPYAFGAFDNGVAVPDAARSLYLKLGDGAARFGDPLATAGPERFWHWLNTAVSESPDAPAITRLWDEVYRSRPDVQTAFPDPCGADRRPFLHWTRQSGTREHGIALELLAPGS